MSTESVNPERERERERVVQELLNILFVFQLDQLQVIYVRKVKIYYPAQP